jgi:hypothetical protein
LKRLYARTDCADWLFRTLPHPPMVDRLGADPNGA